jgi:hypothetical protein
VPRELGQPADWLICSQHNRNLAEGGKLWDSVDASPVLGEITFILPGRAGQKAREVKQELRARHVKLPGLAGAALTCVEAREIGAPAGVKPVDWRLLTNREAQNADAVIELVDWYRPAGKWRCSSRKSAIVPEKECQSCLHGIGAGQPLLESRTADRSNPPAKSDRGGQHANTASWDARGTIRIPRAFFGRTSS